MEAQVPSLDGGERALDSTHFRALYAQAPDAILLLEPDSGIVVSANRAAGDAFGYAPRSLPGRSVKMLAHGESRDRDAGVWEAIVRAVCLRDADVAVVHRDGRKVEVSVSASTIRDARGESVSRVTVWRDISRRRNAEREMMADRRHLRALTYELSIAEERERKRIASGLHDEIGQVLAIARLKLGELGCPGRGSPDARLIDEIRSLVDEASRAARTATFDLSCPVLQQLGLEAAIENLKPRIERSGGPRFRFSSDGGDPPFPKETLAILYRATRELLFNVEKHAHASAVQVKMRRIGDGLLIRVEDDGVGFEPGGMPMRLSPTGGFGLFSITAQMRGIGGRVEFDSAPGAGTRAELHVPPAGRLGSAEPGHVCAVSGALGEEGG